MPRFFINTDDGDHHRHDQQGQDFRDRSSVRIAALKALPHLEDYAMREFGDRTMTVTVWDETGARVYSAALSLRERWEPEGS